MRPSPGPGWTAASVRGRRRWDAVYRGFFSGGACVHAAEAADVGGGESGVEQLLDVLRDRRGGGRSGWRWRRVRRRAQRSGGSITRRPRLPARPPRGRPRCRAPRGSPGCTRGTVPARGTRGRRPWLWRCAVAWWRHARPRGETSFGSLRQVPLNCQDMSLHPAQPPRPRGTARRGDRHCPWWRSAMFCAYRRSSGLEDAVPAVALAVLAVVEVPTTSQCRCYPGRRRAIRR